MSLNPAASPADYSHINFSSLPLTARAKLAELDLELSEGDITQKGYEKKKAQILQPFLAASATEHQNKHPSSNVHNKKSNAKASPKHNSPAARKIRKNQKTRHDERYRSDAHSEVVQQALAKHKNNRIPVLPHGLKRQSLLIHSQEVENNSSDEDIMETTGDGGLILRKDSSSDISSSSPSPATIPKASHAIDLKELQKFVKPRSSFDTNTSTSSSGEDVLDGRVILSTSSMVRKMQSENKNPVPLATKLADIMPQILPGSRPTSQSLPPDVTNIGASPSHTSQPPSVLTKLDSRSSLATEEDSENALAVTKVSAKIQQLLNTLKKPKKKPLTEYFQDDQHDLENVVRDENAPTPGGNKCKLTRGETLAVAANSPHSIEAAIHRYGTANPKCPCLTEVNTNGKTGHTITYGKLLSTMRKVAYTLSVKRNIGVGTRVALVFPNTEPGVYAGTFFGCLMAGIVPVSVEIPLSSKTAGSSQLGFLLRSCGVTTALTSDACMKGLPKTDKAEVVQLKGWPKLQWILTDTKHLNKPSSSWQPPAPTDANQLAYIEYKTTQNNSVVGIAHSRKFILNHCRSVVAALQYNAGDIMLNLLDFKRGCGLVHGILASIYTGMHVYHIPYALMKRDPSQWLAILSKNGASLALTKSRDLHWTMAMHKEIPNLNLRTLRMLLVSDASNPWSVGSCEIFYHEFKSKGLRSDAVCPCAWSDEALTVAVRRPGTEGIKTTLSMNSLSYGVVETEVNNTSTSLLIQDSGSILPNSVAVVKNVYESQSLCRTDEIGEIITSSNSTSAHSTFYGLGGISEKIFECKVSDDRDCEDITFVRTGLMGYVGPSGRVFVTGRYEGVLQISGRSHNADDIVATVLAVEPVRFVYRGRIAVFSIPVLKDDRLIIIVEQKPGATEEECFKWMSNVIQAVDGVHGLGVYCLSLLGPNGLPRTPLGGVHLSETRVKFLNGNLQPCNILMCPHQCVTNLPRPRQKHNDVGAASIMQGQVVTGVRLAQSLGQKLTLADEDNEDKQTNEANRKQQYLSEILKWRAQSTPDHVLFSLINSKGNIGAQLNCIQLHKRAERTAQLLLNAGLTTGDHVALLFPAGLDLIAATYGCFYAGCVPCPIRPPHPKAVTSTIPTVKMIVDVSKAVAVLAPSVVAKTLKSKETLQVLNQSLASNAWPQIIEMEDNVRKKMKVSYWPPTPEMLAFIDFSVSTSGTLMGVKMSHSSVIMLCKSMKLQCELYPSRTVSLCLDPYSGLGFALWCLSSVFAGHHSQLIPPHEVDTNPMTWLQAVSQHKIRDAFLTYTVMEACMRDLAQHVAQLKSRGLTLASVRTCVIIAEERPRVRLVTNFTKLYRDLGLLPRAVSTAFGCRVNVAICLQGSSCPDPTTVYVDARSLRNDRVSLVEKGSPKSICLMESGKILPGVKIAIADPDTLGHCADARLGEVWVSSPHNSNNYFAVYGGDESLNRSDHFKAKLKTGDTESTYARTGYLGFLRRTDLTSATGERHDALYIVGPLEEALEIRGMRYHPVDIENSVVRSSNRITECAIFFSNNLLVVVVELEGPENSALDIIPLVTNVILEEHYLVAGVVAVLDPGSVPVNSRGEKQRMHLRDSFLQDKMDPIYVAYNM